MRKRHQKSYFLFCSFKWRFLPS